MQTVKRLNFWQKAFIYIVASFLFAYFSGFTMADDGLRHIAFAAHGSLMKSWGDVFPHSLFMTTYDPWYAWHAILSGFLIFFPYEHVHIALNTTVLFVFMVLMDQLLERYHRTHLGAFGILVVLSIVALSANRYLNVRPDLLSGLYVMAALLFSKRWTVLFLLTMLYAPAYYLFFLYTGSIGLVYLVLKNYRAFMAVFMGSLISLAIHYYFGGTDFLLTVLYVLNDQTLRSGLNVGEGAPLFSFLSFFNYYALVSILGGFIGWLIYKFYDYLKKQPLALFLLITSILWLAQVRYFALFLPLMLLYLFVELKPMARLVLSRSLLYYGFKFWHILKLAQGRPLFLFLAIPYTAFMLAYSMKNNESVLLQQLENKRYFANENFNNKRILSNSMNADIYFGLYLNPTLHFIPSCGIGWFDGSDSRMKDIYTRMMKPEGIGEYELKSLLDYVKADYYIHTLGSDKQILSCEKLGKIGLKPLWIIDNRIIFKYIP